MDRQIPSNDIFSPSDKGLLQLEADDNMIFNAGKSYKKTDLKFLGYFVTELGSNCNFPFFHKNLNMNLNKKELNEVERATIGVI